MFRVFVQARMSSRRFPGKVLAPLCGTPIILHLLDRLRLVVPPEAIVVATSTESSDDVLEGYLKGIGINVFRGDLENVVLRFQQCLSGYPCDWLFRVCADSPFLDSGFIPFFQAACDKNIDLVTNVQTRTYPPGQSVECLSAESLRNLDAGRLPADEQEHLTLHYYRHPDRFRILNLPANEPAAPDQRYVVDTVDDLHRLECLLLAGEVPRFAPPSRTKCIA